MLFSSDIEMKKLSARADEFFKHVLYDEEPIFVSDEATIWDISTTEADELMRRCSVYYAKSVSIEDLGQPLWKLLRQLNQGR